VRSEYGVEPLPDVPLDYPPWLEDLRSSWVTDENSATGRA
jgi:hypothetical protein